MTVPQDSRPERDLSLEGIRGFASVTVLLWHNLLGFFPRETGNFVELHHSGMRAMPWYGLVYGSAAVIVFFTLSGLVLSRAYLQTGDASIIVRGAMKRWPRLAGPAVVAVVLSAVIDRAGLYSFDQAALVTGSPWLAGHLFHGISSDVRGLFDAARQGLTTFFTGASYYDTNLWTMRYEISGSFLVFGAALVLRNVRESIYGTAYLVIVYFLASAYVDPFMLPFIVGIALADIQGKTALRLPASAGIAMLFLGIYLLGYSGFAAGWYRPLAVALKGNYAVQVQSLAAVLIIVAADATPALRRRLQGRLCAFLGRISFPLYLVHIPVLCSVGCTVFVHIQRAAGENVAGLSAMAATIIVSLLVSLPFAVLNDVWTRTVDRAVRLWTLAGSTP